MLWFFTSIFAAFYSSLILSVFWVIVFKNKGSIINVGVCENDSAFFMFLHKKESIIS